MVVEPVLTVKALDHKLVHLLSLMGFIAVAVAIEEALVVLVLLIVIVLLILELAGERHP
jgi:hypothetical protein